MAWDWDYDIDGTDPLDHAKVLRIVTEYGLASRGDSDWVLPGNHGVTFTPNKLLGAGNVDMFVYLLDSEPDGSVTHVNDRAGHILENLSIFKRLFNQFSRQVTITRSHPHAGEQEILVELVDQPSEGQDRHEVLFPLKAAKPMWRSTTQTVASPGSGNYDPGGDAPVDDAVVTFGGAGSIVNNTNGSGFEVTGACVVNCGTGDVTSGGSPAPGLIVPNNERWLHLEPTNNALVVSGGPSVAFYPKWG